MTKPMIKIANTETKEVIEREMNEVEFAQYKKDLQNWETQTAQAAQAATDKAALLAKLGITADEAKLLLS